MKQRKFIDYIVLSLKGMAMGAADVVPGVSGGTIAFISGIYEELLSAISSVNVANLRLLKTKGLRVAWKAIHGNFLLSLISGIFISILSLARLISYLLETEPVLVWSFFFGLVLASIVYIGKQISKWTVPVILLLIFGAILAYYITTLQPLISENSSVLFMFIAGALAICAMILPGISGAFILVLLGAYKPVLEAIHTKDFKLIAVVGFGAIVGLMTFSKILKWLFNNYRDYILSVLTGFILGSLNKIWPWKETITWRLNSKGIQIPFNQKSILPLDFDGDAQLLGSGIIACAGFILIIFLEKFASNSNKV